jgi:hypothetical protein
MNRIAVFLIAAALPTSALAQKISLVGGTAVNPADGRIVQNAVVVINRDKIESVASRKESDVPVGSRWVECDGKFILPGYIDTHVHFFQSGDLFTRPDGADLNSVRPYKDEVGWIKSHLADTFARYLRCGITSVVDVGGPMWNFEVRKTADSTAKAPRVAVAGPLISSVSREKLDLGDPPIVKIDTPDQAREFVRKLVAQKPDLVKIWYIVDQDHPVDSFRPIVRATIEESHAHKIRVAVHATELETARAAVEEGADVLVHSVIDKPVDDTFVKLLKDRHTILCPTLVVFERYGRTFANKLNFTPEEKSLGQSGSDRVARCDEGPIGQTARADQDGAGQAGRNARSHKENLRCRVQEFKDTGGCWSYDRGRHRRGKHWHHSRSGFIPRVSINEGSRADAHADSAICYFERRAFVRRRNRCAHWQNRKGIFRRSRGSELESG